MGNIQASGLLNLTEVIECVVVWEPGAFVITYGLDAIDDLHLGHRALHCAALTFNADGLLMHISE